MKAIAYKLGRSTQTPMEHIHSHNEAVLRSSFCPSCKKVSSSYQSKRAERAKEHARYGNH